MKLIKTTGEHKIYQRRDGRHAVTTLKNMTVNAEEKVKVLLAEELIKVTAANPAAPEEAPAEEAAPEEEAGE